MSECPTLWGKKTKEQIPRRNEGSRTSAFDINVDGDPLNPMCPSGDSCPPDIGYYNGDIEVDADIEMQLAIAPDARRILVYNAPDDETGLTQLDELSRIANDDIADVVGPFCTLNDRTVVGTLDPTSQPLVTSVGGTSLESFNPGMQSQPLYPQGIETVWNVDNLCNNSANEGGDSGIFWCNTTGAGGGGNSQFWRRPQYQFGPGREQPV